MCQLVQDFSPIVYNSDQLSSQLCLFRNACCLSDKSLCLSKCATILEHTVCPSNLQGTQGRSDGYCKPKTCLFFKRVDIYLLETIP